MNTLVVGASRGLGLELVRASLERGDRVVALYQNSSDGLTEPGERFSEALEICPADVRREEDLAAAAARLASYAGRVQRLIYNAAIHLERDRGDLLSANVDDIALTLDVNTVGAVRALKHLRPLLAADGTVVLISSEAGSIGQCWRDSEYGYCMSKAALNMLARLLELREKRRSPQVQVRTIHPGWLRTDMGGPNADDSPREAALELLALLDAAAAASIYTDRHGQVMPW
jgi:NAD(P)-dependent dehydrogenase (short-subunit alcohol dehydrogenase family)